MRSLADTLHSTDPARARAVIRELVGEVRVAAGESVIRAFSSRLTSPDHYAWRFTNEELAVIREETKATGARVGY